MKVHAANTRAGSMQRVWQRKILLLCWISYALSYLCRTNLSIALPGMTEEFSWSASSAGLIGSAFFISYAAGHLLSGIAGDRLPIKKFLCAGMFGTSLCNLLMGFFPVYGVILAVWTVNGLFLSTLWGPIVRAIAVWYSPDDRNSPAVIISFSSLAGYLLSWAGLGLLIQYASWRAAFFLPGAVTLCYSFLFAAKMNDNPARVGLTNYSRPAEEAEAADSSQERPVSLWTLVREQRLLYFCVAALAQGVIKDGITLWEPTILTDLYDASAGIVATASSLIPLCSFFGVFLSGRLMNRYYGREKKPGMLLFLGTGCCCLLFFLLLGRSLWLDVLFFSVISALLCGVNTLLLTFIPLRLSACGRSSSVAGLFNFFAYLGAGSSGILSGALVDRWGWSSTVLLWAGLCLLGIVMIAAGFRGKPAAAEDAAQPGRHLPRLRKALSAGHAGTRP